MSSGKVKDETLSFIISALVSCVDPKRPLDPTPKSSNACCCLK